jgi:NADH-quinone oxidoreductase subunit A
MRVAEIAPFQFGSERFPVFWLEALQAQDCLGGHMGEASYFPIAVQVALAISTALIILVVSHLFGQRMSGNRIKDSAYECGMLPLTSGASRFSIKFYATAMLFILFDIEVVFLIPWSIVYRDFLHQGIPILAPVLFFMGVMVAGLVYEIKKGAIEWDR